MNTFLRIFSSSGGSEKWLEDEINEFARNQNLEIVSASPCFRKGFIDSDYMFVTVIFRKVTGNDSRTKNQGNERA